MKKNVKYFSRLFLVIAFGILFAFISQLFIKEPVDRYIHIRNFRYGKDPSVIRVNRGDRLHLTFSSDDTGHSFFLEEFDIDAKVMPSQDEIAVFKTSNPSLTPLRTKEISFEAKYPGILNYLISKSNFRCHVYCGPMHAFEQGKLIIMPNTLLFFSIGCLIGILCLWIIRIFRKDDDNIQFINAEPRKDLFKSFGFLKKLVTSRWPQIILMLFAMAMIYLVIMTSLFGTKVSGRNLGVLLMWTIWLFLLIALMTPLGGRVWCTICPLPFFGDLIQRGSAFSPIKGRTKEYNNKFSGLFLKWPKSLNNSWLRLFVFLIFATFSTTLVAIPRVSGLTILILMIVPTFMAFIWEHRAFCRYICPVSVFVGPFSNLSPIALRNKSQEVCDKCKPHFCQKGNINGWACPYGVNVGELKDNEDCGLCLECTRTCTYDNISLFVQPFAQEHSSRNMSEGWLAIAIFTISIIYSVLYLGHYPVVRDYVNIMDKQNWGLFGIYALILWTLLLLVIPGLVYSLSAIGARLSKVKAKKKDVFLSYTGSLLPLGLFIWIAFVIPMLFVNITFIQQSASDPFGWGWDFFGTANIPWHQFLPEYIPWFQAVMLLIGLYLSLRNILNKWNSQNLKRNKILVLVLPFCIFITSITLAMLLFFTN